MTKKLRVLLLMVLCLVVIGAGTAYADKRVSIDDGTVTLWDDNDALPTYSTLEVKAVSGELETDVYNAIRAVVDEKYYISAIYSYDVKVFDTDWNEVQPDPEKGNVSITFDLTTLNDISGIYCVTENAEGVLEANTVTTISRAGVKKGTTIPTDEFGIFSFAVTRELKYVSQAPAELPLTTILSTIGLPTENVTTVSSDNQEKLSVSADAETGAWTVNLKEYDSENTLTVTIDGAAYAIKVCVDKEPVQACDIFVSLFADRIKGSSGQNTSKYSLKGIITSTGVNKNVTIQATHGSLLSLDNASAGLYTDYECTNPYTGSYQKNNLGFPTVIDQMEDGQKLYLKYTMTLDTDSIEGKYKSADDERRETISVQSVGADGAVHTNSDKYAVIYENFGIKLDGKNNGDGTVTWYVYVNTSGELYNLRNLRVSEYVAEPQYQQLVEGSFHICQYKGSGSTTAVANYDLSNDIQNSLGGSLASSNYKALPENSGKVGFDYRFSGRDNYNRYLITFKTKVDNGIGKVSATATANSGSVKVAESTQSVNVQDYSWTISTKYLNTDTSSPEVTWQVILDQTTLGKDVSLDVYIPKTWIQYVAGSAQLDADESKTTNGETLPTLTEIVDNDGKGIGWNLHLKLNQDDFSPAGYYVITYKTKVLREVYSSVTVTNKVDLHNDRWPSGVTPQSGWSVSANYMYQVVGCNIDYEVEPKFTTPKEINTLVPRDSNITAPESFWNREGYKFSCWITSRQGDFPFILEDGIKILAGESINPDDIFMKEEYMTSIPESVISYNLTLRTLWTLEEENPVIPRTSTYNGTAQTLVATEVPFDATVHYQINGGDSSTKIPKATEPGTYVVKYTIEAEWMENITGEVTAEILSTAVAPTISTVTGADLTYGYTEGSVSVTATPAEGHTITGYQWYSNTSESNEGGTLIEGATSASYDIPTGKDAGSYYYYCVVTATEDSTEYPVSATSDAATVTVKPLDVNVTITGHNNTTDYDGNEHSVTGYDVTADTPLYTEAYVQLSGKAEAKGTDAGTTYMGLKEEQFSNTNANFGTVTFDVTDGYQTISPIEATVTITGHTNTTDYDGNSHSVSGYDAVIGTPLYKEADFTFNGSTEASGINAGTTYMGLKPELFTNTNANFGTVTFNVTDGYQTILPSKEPVTVTITGHYDETEYDGEAHSVTGYDASFSVTDYTADDISFNGNAKAEQTDVGNAYMGLTPEQFSNTSANYQNVTFSVTDGYQTITPSTDEVTVTITGHNIAAPYDGTEHSVSGYDVSCSTTLYTEADFSFYGSAQAKRTDAGITYMSLSPEQFSNTNGNFANVTFNVTDGFQKINKISAAVTITGHVSEVPYDGNAHSVSGYDVSTSTPLYTEADFSFSGSAKAEQTEVGTKYMGLKPGQFSNTNGNFENVTFIVTDGLQTIKATTENVTVTITGHTDTAPYDGTEHSVSGFDISSSTPLYTVDAVAFSGNAEAKRTGAGTTNMGLAPEQFTNTNDNFSNVTFKVEDGWMTITKVDATMQTVPTAKENLYYNGNPQVLLEVNTEQVLEYTLDQATWSTELPTATEVGSYAVGCRVKGDENHNPSESVSLTAWIEKVSANTVMAEIEALTPFEYTSAYKLKLQEVQEDYDALAPAHKEMVTNLDDLRAAQKKYADCVTAEETGSKIKDILSDIDSFTLENEPDVEEARQALASLTADQVEALEYVGEGEKELLDAILERAYDKLDALNVEALIDDIGTVTISDECKERIDIARNDYDGLSDSAKEMVRNLDTLIAAEKMYADLQKIDKVKEQILSLPDKVTLYDAEEVKAARRVYDNLTDDQIALLEEIGEKETLEEKLAGAEAQLTALSTGSSEDGLFADVRDPKAYYYKPVYWAAANGLTSGYAEDNTFRPQENCTRGQMVVFLWRLAGAPEPQSTEMKFTDVSESDYYYKAVLWAVENEITKGYSEDNTFRPNETCLREHAAMFLWRVAGKPTPKTKKNPFTDVSKRDYYYKAVLWASENKIAKGYLEDHTYRPKDICLREHIVTFLYRFNAYGFKPVLLTKGELLLRRLQAEPENEEAFEFTVPEDGLIEDAGADASDADEIGEEETEEILYEPEEVIGEETDNIVSEPDQYDVSPDEIYAEDNYTDDIYETEVIVEKAVIG